MDRRLSLVSSVSGKFVAAHFGSFATLSGVKRTTRLRVPRSGNSRTSVASIMRVTSSHPELAHYIVPQPRGNRGADVAELQKNRRPYKGGTEIC